MRVKAAPGLKVPKEGEPRKYITENVSEDVSESTYYRRRLLAGELLLAPEEAGDVTPVGAKPTVKSRKESQS